MEYDFFTNVVVRPPYQVQNDKFRARIEPTKGCTYQVYRYSGVDTFISTVATLETAGLDRANRQLAQMFAAAPDMMRLLLDIYALHQNDLPESMLDEISNLIDNIRE